jgi:acetyl esterase/lipase/sugar lactone lactonase YvrE
MCLGQQRTDFPVNTASPLEVIREDFGLADGAAASGNVLYVPDVKGKSLFAYQVSASGKNSWKTIIQGDGAYSGTFFQLGQLYLADGPGRRIMVLDPNNQLNELCQFEEDVRPNDLVVDSAGNVYVTITKQGEVRRISPAGEMTTVLRDIETPNGITLSPDESILYVSLYKPGVVIQAALGPDGVGPSTLFATMEPTATGALADGMCIDRAGNVYCAAAEAVWIWSPAAQLLQQIRTPTRPINCTFGGQHGQDLYISTFGGLVRQGMLVNGVPSAPASQGNLANVAGKPSTEIQPSIVSKFNQVYYVEGSRKLICDTFAPSPKPELASGRQLPAIVLVHGGGWLHGDKTKFRPLALQLAERGYFVMSIEYRLGGEAHFPAAIFDCNAATRYLRSNAIDLGVDPERIGAVGGSAGGHLVGLMATGADAAELHSPGDVVLLAHGQQADSSRLQAAVVMAGPMQIASGSVAERSRHGMESNATHWLGKSLDEDPTIYQLADAFEKISGDDPPFLFITGSEDSPSRDVPSLEKFKQVGVVATQVIHEGATHGHWTRADWIQTVADDICSFLDAHL